MSYILDALRRAEHDRRNAQSSPIEQVAIASQPQAAAPYPRRRIVAAAILLVSIICLAAVAYGLWHHFRHHVMPPVAQLPVLIPAGQPALKPVRKLQSSPAAKPAPAATAPVTPHPNPIADAARLSSLNDLMPPKPVAKVASHHVVATASQTPTATLPIVAHSVPTIAATIPAAPSSVSSKLATATTAKSAASMQPSANTEKLKAMPDSYRANFPQITVQVHVYDSNPAKRWVLIDGRRYKEGDTLPQGPKIYKIVQAGIVFDWQGQRVLYPVGS